MITSLFPLAGIFTSLLDTTPTERKEKGGKPVGILASLTFPIHLLRMMELKPNVKNSFVTYFISASLLTGAQWCAGRQLGHLLGRVLDEQKIKGT